MTSAPFVFPGFFGLRSAAPLLTTALVLTAAFGPPRARAQDSDLVRLFPHRAAIEGPSDGSLCQLPLSAEVLAGTRPDLSDLRILSGDGHEVPYLLDRAAIRWPSDGPPPVRAVTPEEVARERDEVKATEELTFRIPSEPLPEGATWTLHLETSSPDFVRSYTLEGDAAASAGSVFRLPSPLRERLRVPLPGAAPGKVYRLRLEGEGAYLEPVLRLVAGPMADRTSRLVTDLELLRVESLGQQTRMVFARPGAVVPSELLFHTESAFFSRQVRVEDVRRGRPPVLVAEGLIFRAPAVGAEEFSVTVGQAIGEELWVTLEDGDSPALEALGARAVTERPALVFACQRDLRLYFGGGRVRRPAYDTQRFAGTVMGERIARSGASASTLASTEANPALDDGPALAPFVRAGAEVDRSRFRSRAPLVVRGAREGVSRLTPDPALLARASPTLSDLRVVGAGGRQWPYVRAPRTEPVVAPLVVERESLSDGRTRYLLSHSGGALALARVRLRTPAAFVERAYVARAVPAEGPLDALGPADSQYRGVLRREPGGDAPLVVELGSEVGTVELVVTDGNDAPLDLEGEGEVDAPVFHLLAPDGTYDVLVGADLPSPSYEVSHALPLVLATPVVDAELGATEGNPAFAPPPVAPAFTIQQVVVWAVLLLAVLVLGAITFRATRHRDPIEGSAPDVAGSAAPAGRTEGGVAPAPGAATESGRDPAEPAP